AFAGQRFAKAIDLFVATLTRYPQHPRRDAIYLGIADAYVAKRDYRQALAELERFYADSRDSPRAAEALLKIAECHAELRNLHKARLALRLLRKRFPDSPSAAEGAKLGRRLSP